VVNLFILYKREVDVRKAVMMGPTAVDQIGTKVVVVASPGPEKKRRRDVKDEQAHTMNV
jgi:hypothetical protein